MPDLTALAAFSLAVLVIELTPGPNMAWLAVLSASEGRRAGLMAVAGVALGLLAIGAAAALGLSALIAGSPVLYDGLRWAGSLFLLYLAFEGWREAGESSPARIEEGNLRHFSRGFVINALNPKAGLFYVAVLPEFIDHTAPVAPQAAALTALSVAIATGVHLVIVALAGSAQAFLNDPVRNRIARRVLAVLLAGIAVWLFLSTAR
ncbi:LysE family translocator [Hyphobacterium marinum]|uniref:LysE family translocator n=1 Tax=Hyphobacterium marinum TaxID=3116574 RepID=A0ABU7LV79_9PROT|nr:LysE family translocator [Hyphobacterium sp. Y6023]MEE2565396.1 LysE family translocator [Hyphobacterium sp. Y6023]